MPTDLSEFYEEFLQEIYTTSESTKQFAEDAFFDLFCGELSEAGELDAVDRAQYVGARGIRVDGYGGDHIVGVAGSSPAATMRKVKRRRAFGPCGALFGELSPSSHRDDEGLRWPDD